MAVTSALEAELSSRTKEASMRRLSYGNERGADREFFVYYKWRKRELYGKLMNESVR
jgi:hypothetical protein